MKKLAGVCTVVALGGIAFDASALPTIYNLTGAEQTFTTKQGNTTTVVNVPMVNPEPAIVNGGQFYWDNSQAVGSGIFQPFLRLDIPGNDQSEQGYNTTLPSNQLKDVFENIPSVNFTHDVEISSLVAVDGFYEFTLDINEPGADKKSLLTLDGLRLYTTNTGGQSGTKTEGSTGDMTVGNIVGTRVYDLDDSTLGTSTIDGNNAILLDYNRSGGGSGIADMKFKIEASKVNTGDKYLVLWSRFGVTAAANTTPATGADAGFEEWAFRQKSGTPPPPPPPGGVPLPGSSSLALLGLAVMGWRMRQQQQPVSPAS